MAVLLILVACSNELQAKQKAFNGLIDHVQEVDPQIKEARSKYNNIADQYQSGELSDEEAYNKLDQLKARLTKLSDSIYDDYEIPEDLPADFYKELESAQSKLSGSIFELAKMSGHFRNYVMSGKEEYRTKVDERHKAYQEELKEASKRFEQIRNKLEE